MDYALQFYRHLVEHHGATIEAQEAREGLFRIAEWRWGEGRGGSRATSRAAQAPQPSPPPPAPVRQAPPAGAEHAYAAVARNERMPDAITRGASGRRDDPWTDAIAERYRAAKYIALVITALGWACTFGGFAAALLGGGGLVAEVSTPSTFGLPLGVAYGVPAIGVGLILIVTGQLAVAVFENTNATLGLVAIERARSGY